VIAMGKFEQSVGATQRGDPVTAVELQEQVGG
jgi:hypothetical protein